MGTLMFLVLLGFHHAAAVTHSLKYFYTASSNVANFPEFVTVGMVDDLQIDHYDSNTGRAQIKQNWMEKVLAEDPEYLDRNTQTYMGNQPSFKANIEIVRQRFNQTKGVHTFQEMYGCEWDEKTGDIKGFHQFGYDGDIFISLDLQTATWVASKQQAVITKHKWDKEKAYTDYWINYHAQICPEWLKKYVSYGKSSLQRTVRPSMSFLQKTPSSPVSCHATGFYPNGAELLWRKDGEEIHEGVDKGEVLPNNDGTFQMSTDLKLSSVPTEDWMKYECVFQLLGEEEDLITQLEKRKLVGHGSGSDFPVVAAVIGVLVGMLVLAGAGFFCWKKGNHGFKRTNNSDTSSSSHEDSDSKKEDNEKQKMMGANC